MKFRYKILIVVIIGLVIYYVIKSIDWWGLLAR